MTTTDRLDVLRLPIVPIDPRPEFADALERRLEQGDPPRALPARDPVPRATVRYFVDDLRAAVSFYCRLLGFEEELRPSPAFAMLYRGDLRLLLSVVGAAHALPDGTLPEPGGWNRMALEVTDLAGTLQSLRDSGVLVRAGVVGGVAVHQVLIQDPSGNLIELFEPTAGYHERPRDPA